MFFILTDIKGNIWGTYTVLITKSRGPVNMVLHKGNRRWVREREQFIKPVIHWHIFFLLHLVGKKIYITFRYVQWMHGIEIIVYFWWLAMVEGLLNADSPLWLSSDSRNQCPWYSVSQVPLQTERQYSYIPIWKWAWFSVLLSKSSLYCPSHSFSP